MYVCLLRFILSLGSSRLTLLLLILLIVSRTAFLLLSSSCICLGSIFGVPVQKSSVVASSGSFLLQTDARYAALSCGLMPWTRPCSSYLCLPGWLWALLRSCPQCAGCQLQLLQGSNAAVAAEPHKPSSPTAIQPTTICWLLSTFLTASPKHIKNCLFCRTVTVITLQTELHTHKCTPDHQPALVAANRPESAPGHAASLPC
jgi:hypothetical protein